MRRFFFLREKKKYMYVIMYHTDIINTINTYMYMYHINTYIFILIS